MKKELGPIKQELLRGNDDTYCYLITQDGYELAKYWSRFDEPLNEFLERILNNGTLSVNSIIKLYSK